MSRIFISSPAAAITILWPVSTTILSLWAYLWALLKGKSRGLCLLWKRKKQFVKVLFMFVCFSYRLWHDEYFKEPKSTRHVCKQGGVINVKSNNKGVSSSKYKNLPCSVCSVIKVNWLHTVILACTFSTYVLGKNLMTRYLFGDIKFKCSIFFWQYHHL